MARDKQLVVRVTDTMRGEFQSFCERKGVKASTVLAEIIERLCQGDLSLEVALGRSESPALAMQQLETLVEQRVDEALSAWLASSQLTERIEVVLTPRLGEVEAKTYRAISDAMAAFQDQETEVKGAPELAEPTMEMPPVVPAKSLPKKDLQIDLSAYDPQVGFTYTELARAIGLKATSPIADAIRTERFASWSRKKDPDGRPWYFQGEKTERRFFRGCETD